MGLSTPEELRRLLNPPQWEAVSHGGGPLLILAGAGSGKTRVLTYRIAYLIAFAGINPHAILALTFTNKAAREMRHRVEALLGSRAAGTWIGTFHGICLRILRSHSRLLPVGPDFAVYDADDQKKIAHSAFAELGLDPRRYNPQGLLHRVQRAKDEALGPEEMDAGARNPFAAAARSFYARYQEKLRQANALDFGDLLLETYRLFQAHPDVAEHYRRRFEHLLIDEYQDTNHVQYLLAREIGRARGNLCVVGDDDQSIYRWRGADVRNILSFEKDFPGAKIVKLEQNYRSTQAILSAASELVAHNERRHEKVLWTDRQGGDAVRVHAAPTEEEEARWVAETVRALVGSDRGLHFSDIAVLYRMHALSRAFEEAFLRYRIPYAVYGGLRFYDRKEIKDALAYLRLSVNPNDPIALARVINVPPRGIGKTTIERVFEEARREGIPPWQGLERVVGEGLVATRQARALAAFASLVEQWRADAPSLPLRELLVRILEESGYVAALRLEASPEGQERLENLEELLNAAEAFEVAGEGGLREFLDRSALVTDQDLGPDRADVVTLMTLHAAKGLEYSVVFLAGLEEGVLPHERSSDEPEELEEERRLCYVGITRAKETLFLSRARVRRVYGAEGILRPPSRFLVELPRDVRETVTGRPGEGPGASLRSAGAPPVTGLDRSGRFYVPDPEEAAFVPGLRVRHPRYGFGTVEAVEGGGPASKVTVRFEGAGLKKFVAALAGLEVET
ncbi:MAG: UvrD-helicase domain-containing protein [Deltaproteobacteria bacterium]|nr:UvrD-helicase domain-containing protein [Deltaproteobacteria bacterium]